MTKINESANNTKKGKRHKRGQSPVQPQLFYNRNNKDFLFRYVLSDKQVLLELYNALNGTTYQNSNDLHINTLKDIVYIGYKNDLSFLLGNTLNLYEHQSTINPNMPLRGLFYITSFYEGHIALNGGNLYRNKPIRLPLPQYIIFYNGNDKMPERQEMHLSDAYTIMRDDEPDGNRQTADIDSTDYNKNMNITNLGTAKPCLELTATIININHGHNKELLRQCRGLEEYALFVERVRQYLNQGLGMESALEEAIETCINDNILSDILLKNKAEVKKMLLTQFDVKEYIAGQRADGYEEGLENGRAQGIAQGFENGRAQGLENGIRIFIEDNQEEGISAKRIIEKLQKRFNLTASEAGDYLNRYRENGGTL